MIKHIVFWRLKPDLSGPARAENLAEIKHRLEGLAGKIPGLLKIEVGLNFDPSERASDAALYSELTSRDVLEAYQNHPDHVVIKTFISQVVSEARVVDYEIA